MSNTLSVASVIEANRLSSDTAFIALLDIQVIDPDTGTTVAIRHFANNPDPVVYMGTVYEAGKFDIQVKQESGKQAEVSLSITDYTQTVQAYMESYGGGIGFGVTFYVVSAAELDRPADMQLDFQIVAATSAGYVQQFTLGAENVLALPFPRRRQTLDFCQNQFKSQGPGMCNYTGAATSCDLTLKGANGCAAKNNTLNFGAFRGLNSNGFRYV